jgi:hypothetical protein
MNIVPNGYEQYQWIADRFSNIKNVEVVVMGTNDDGMYMLASNNMSGNQKKVFMLPLKGMFKIDYTLATDVEHPYDIMDLDIEGRENMVNLAIHKARILFS